MRAFISLDRQYTEQDHPLLLLVRIPDEDREIPIFLKTAEDGTINIEDFEELGAAVRAARLRMEKADNQSSVEDFKK